MISLNNNLGQVWITILDQAYQNNVIMEYKMKHLFKLESDNYRLNKKIEE